MEFQIGDQVQWSNNAFQEPCSLADTFGDGPFNVIAIIPVAPDKQGETGHSQLLLISKTVNGIKMVYDYRTKQWSADPDVRRDYLAQNKRPQFSGAYFIKCP